MRKTKTYKRSISMLLAIAMLFSIFSVLSIFNVSAATDRVSMYSTGVYFSKYGMTTRDIYIQTKDNASNQQVYVHYNYLDGQEWQDEQATYLTTLSDGSKIWQARVSSYNFKYAIKYVADGVTYWDNNNGNDYTREEIGVAPVTVRRDGYQSLDDYTVNALVQNYAYQKNVVVRYTEDDWATYTDVPMSYVSSNGNNTELWTVDLSLNSSDAKGFEYCVYYQVNGQTYWANNFGQNYDWSYHVNQ